MTDQERGLDTKDSHAGYVDEGAVAHDEVFGDLTERGPNYRNVSTMSSCKAITPNINNIQLGWLDWIGHSHGQNPDWSGCSLDSGRF